MLQKPPSLPIPPKEYSGEYFRELTRVLYLYFQQGANPGPIYGTTLTLSDIPGSGSGLPPGAVWRNGADLKVVVADGVYAPSYLISGKIGNVTVVV